MKALTFYDTLDFYKNLVREKEIRSDTLEKKPMKNDFTKNKPQEDNEQALAWR